MTIPENNVFVDGQGQVDADALNTFVQMARTMADLRAFIGASNMEVLVLGQNAVNDGLGGTFYWNAGAVAPVDDNLTTIVPFGASQGCWSRVVNIIPASGTWTPTLAGTTTAGAPVYTVQNGFYNQVGKIVTAFFNVEISDVGGMVGPLIINGLPLMADPAAGNTGAAIITAWFGATLPSSGSAVTGLVLAGSTWIELIANTNTGTVNLAASTLSPPTQFVGMAIYQSP